MRKIVTYLLLGLLSLGLTSSFAEAPKKKAKQSAARGATARTPPAPPNPANDAAFLKHDLNRDGQVSKAEAAGHYDLIMGFDRSDRNRDGKLSRAEYDRYTERLATAKTRTASRK